MGYGGRAVDSARADDASFGMEPGADVTAKDPDAIILPAAFSKEENWEGLPRCGGDCVPDTFG